ncbi:uncharacterized protein EDB93DRAFT_1253701 [Suillus bovinus]|uniref:uncharacterized protein n=1 Tax=Suillus bovinus TaxID=48563 RepID=UPI001B870E71|nr:uncharacterized protein EDB93DRAFT_1253701 [Suillus bovinus]KAG2137448.1 hypothetical protein EDB93DRAFT_1253701 [Suillus bovinus]
MVLPIIDYGTVPSTMVLLIIDYGAVPSPVVLPKIDYGTVLSSLVLPMINYGAFQSSVVLPKIDYRTVPSFMVLPIIGYGAVPSSVVLSIIDYGTFPSTMVLPIIDYEAVHPLWSFSRLIMDFPILRGPSQDLLQAFAILLPKFLYIATMPIHHNASSKSFVYVNPNLKSICLHHIPFCGIWTGDRRWKQHHWFEY